MNFVKKKKLFGRCDDPPEDRVISIFTGCLANHDRAHSQRVSLGEPPFYGVPQDAGGGGGTHKMQLIAADMFEYIGSRI